VNLCPVCDAGLCLLIVIAEFDRENPAHLRTPGAWETFQKKSSRGVGNGEWGIGEKDTISYSAFRNPHSPFPFCAFMI